MDADLVVIGGGASATLLLDALRRRCPARARQVVVVEGRHRPGRGVPYRTHDPAHRMNVPAVRLSVDPADPDHLVRWLESCGRSTEPSEYIPRRLYGDYLEWVFAGCGRRTRNVRVSVVRASVSRVDRVPGEDGFVVTTDDDRTLRAGEVVLATGAPDGPLPLPLDADLAGDPAVVTDPWARGGIPGDPGDRTVVVGTGLTMVDVALSVLRRPGTTVDAVSRHGLLPRSHPAVRAPAELPLVVPSGPLTVAALRGVLLHQMRREPSGWAAAVDQLRDASGELWPRLSPGQQATLLRRCGTEWSVHRHRMAPEVAMELRAARSAGRLRVHAGRVVRVAREGQEVAVTVHPGPSDPLVLTGDAVVACTGAPGDIRATTDPLLRHLFRRGLAAPGPHRLGVAIDADGTLLGPTGARTRGLSTIGALRRGTVFETTAIPELRVQATELAARLSP